MLDASLAALDRDHLIHPVASYRGHEAAGVHILKSGRGVWVTDVDGREFLDGFGLWCVNAGYGQQALIDAAHRQMQELPYATGYFSLGSEPAIRLAAELARLAPGDLNRVYFTLGGSDAIDSTVRFIRYYQQARGKPEKDQMISLGNGYHGSSSTGAGLTALPVFHAGFGLPLAWQHKLASPHPYRHPAGAEGLIAASTAELRAKVEELGGPERVAAFFAEPIQGSGGVIVPPRGWLKAMRELCRELDILFVADEVITGFGRTGPLFACEEEGIVPDFMTLAKGLTSAYAPMGAVIMTDAVYEVIADGAGSSPVGHGYTYSGHPVSAAVGLAALELYTRGGLVEAGRRAGERFLAGLRELGNHPLVGEVRGRGLLAAVELVTDRQEKTPLPPEAGARLFARSIEQGVIMRAFAQGVLAFAPALCISDDEIDILLERTRRVLDLTLEDPEVRAAMR